MMNYIKSFGIIVFIISSFSRIMRLLKCRKKIINTYVNWKNRYISNWLWKRFNTIAIYDQKVVDNQDDNYVFVFWLQGENSAPPIVKSCISSIRNHCLDRKLIVLDKKNYSTYVTLPKLLIDKYITGGGKYSTFL